MRALTILLATMMLSLAPATALAGHVQVDINPCREGSPVYGCNDGEPIPECWRYTREKGWVYYPDPVFCPDRDAASSCLAIGLVARDANGLVSTQNSRSAASTYSWNAGSAQAAADQQSLTTFAASEGTLVTSCQTQSCDSSARAIATEVSLLGGLITAGALEATASAHCMYGPGTTTTVTNLVIAGMEFGNVVHPSTVFVPGVGLITIGQSATFTTPNGGWGVSTTALRVDVIDAFGTYHGTIRVSHAAAAI